MQWYLSSCNCTACVDARRQARRAFLAFSSDDPKVKITETEPIEGDTENFPEEPVNDDVWFSKSTPVRSFCYQSYINVVDFIWLSSNSITNHI